MLLIVSLMLAGISIGFFIVSRDDSGKIVKTCGKLQQISTVILLFMMGAWLGGNPEFWRDIKTIGFHGFLFALVTIAGSVLAVFFVSKLFAGEEKQ